MIQTVYKVPSQVDEDGEVLYAPLTDLSFATAETGWAVGSGQVLLTRDGGRSWREVFETRLRRYGLAPWKVCAVSPATCWVIGLLSGSDVYCCYTRDAGRRWQVQKFPPGFFPNALSFAGAKRGWIVGDDKDYFSRAGKILVTNDGGRSWDEIELGLEGRPTKVQFCADGGRGWLIESRLSADGERISSLLHASADGGRQWQRVAAFRRDIFSLYALDTETLFVAGEDGFVAVSSDGGGNWERLNTRCRGNINSLCFYDRSLGFALSDFGLFLLTTDGGATWQRVKELKHAGNMIAAHFLSKKLALVVSSFGIYRLELPEVRVL